MPPQPSFCLKPLKAIALIGLFYDVEVGQHHLVARIEITDPLGGPALLPTVQKLSIGSEVTQQIGHLQGLQ